MKKFGGYERQQKKDAALIYRLCSHIDFNRYNLKINPPFFFLFINNNTFLCVLIKKKKELLLVIIKKILFCYLFFPIH